MVAYVCNKMNLSIIVLVNHENSCNVTVVQYNMSYVPLSLSGLDGGSSEIGDSELELLLSSGEKQHNHSVASLLVSNKLPPFLAYR